MAKPGSPDEGLISGPFAGDYSDKLLHSLVVSCETKEKPQLESFGRELQPYFSSTCPEGNSGFSALEQEQPPAGTGKDSKPLSESGRRSSSSPVKQKLPRKPPGDPKGSPQASVSNKRTKRAKRGSSPRYFRIFLVHRFQALFRGRPQLPGSAPDLV